MISKITNFLNDYCLEILNNLKKSKEKIKKKISEETSDDEKKLLESEQKSIEYNIREWLIFNKESSRTEYIQRIVLEFAVDNHNPEILNKLDKTEYCIPVKKGKVFNWFKNELVERTKEHYFTSELAVEYDPEPQYCKDALYKIMCRNDEMTKFMMKCLAYGCFGVNNQKKIFVFHGPDGHNGKTVVFHMIKGVMGHFYSAINPSLFKETRDEKSNKPELIALEKKRFAQITELNSTDCLNNTFLKSVSGKDVINIRDNYATSENVKDIMFNFVIYIMTNSFPNQFPDEALWKRFIFFPFEAVFKDESEVNEDDHIYKDNKELLELFLNDEKYKSSTLNMLIEGARLYFSEGFTNIPEKCKDKTEGMKQERAEDHDPLTFFLKESFIKRADKIERAEFNQYVNKYSKLKFRKNYKPAVINDMMRIKGFSEKRIKGTFYFEKINIDNDEFEKWIKENNNLF
jgi:phage/plasmid-associated DNA primase